jgi:hypothetical protein
VEGRDPGNGKEENIRQQIDKGGLTKNEEATINMVMVVTTKSKAPKEVAFQERELLKGKDPQDWQ